MSGPTNTRPSALLFCYLLLLLAMAVFLIFGTLLIKLPQNTTSMIPNYSYGNTDSLKTLFPERNGRPIKMLYWTRLFGSLYDWEFQSAIERGCPKLSKTCEFTTDRTQYNDSDVVLFPIKTNCSIPKYRLRFQKWVFATRESPVNIHRNMSQERWLYNITMTYKRASDVTWFYGECRRKNTKPATSHVKYNYAGGKKHLIAWFVSNCNTQSRRERYVRELARHVDVHKFGCGGKFSCPRTKHKYCDTVLLNGTYKFYLSFENSLCTEYVTEKLYRILNLNVVPIVLGYSNYSAFLPPHSFIDVRDFDSPKKLAAYLKMLNENDTEYNRYFAWKQTHTCAPLPHWNAACKLCRYVQRQRQRIQVADVVQFWDHNTNCIDAEQFYRGVMSM